MAADRFPGQFANSVSQVVRSDLPVSVAVVSFLLGPLANLSSTGPGHQACQGRSGKPGSLDFQNTNLKLCTHILYSTASALRAAQVTNCPLIIAGYFAASQIPGQTVPGLHLCSSPSCRVCTDPAATSRELELQDGAGDVQHTAYRTEMSRS